ncbi:MAG: hypothetical protein E7413_03055 [Ruminococcaceae bacterium]|nr:hypothetical protein [Oscillospiraceae bacterium]
MKVLKRLSFTLAIVFTAMILFTMSAFALTEGDWEFKLLDNKVKITDYIGEGGDVIVPETLYGFPVTEMQSWTYLLSHEDITSITFPTSLETIPAQVCCSVNERLTTVSFPDTLKKIDSVAFEGCRQLTNVYLPDSLEEIGDSAFAICPKITSVNFPKNLRILGDGVFADSGLTEVDVPYIEQIGESLFAGCENLEKATLAVGYTEIPNETFVRCYGLKEVVIPETVTDIGSEAFKDCTSLKQIILPVGLKSIGSDAFRDCDSLTEVVIPYGVESIGYAFRDCDNLKSLYIPDTVTSISPSILGGSDNCIIYCSAGSVAEEVCKKNEISYITDESVNSVITVLYNGTRISFHSYGQNPELLESRTLVPLRSIFEAMGADVEWDQSTSTAIAKRDGVEIKIQIGANEMYKDGKSIPVDVPARLLNDRTMVPVRVIAESFGANVEWNQNGRTVLITE